MWILSKINNQFHHLAPPSKKSGADDYVEELKLLQVYSPNTGIFELIVLTSWKEKEFFFNRLFLKNSKKDVYQARFCEKDS